MLETQVKINGKKINEKIKTPLNRQKKITEDYLYDLDLVNNFLNRTQTA